MSKHPLYDAAVNEVRGNASPREQTLLSADVVQWREALQSVLDNIDAQFQVRREEFEDATYDLDRDSREYKTAEFEHEAWRAKTFTFKKHIAARLLAVKRMVQEAGEGHNQATVSAAAMVVLEAVGAFLDAEATGTDAEYSQALDALQEAYSAYEGE